MSIGQNRPGPTGFGRWTRSFEGVNRHRHRHNRSESGQTGRDRPVSTGRYPQTENSKSCWWSPAPQATTPQRWKEEVEAPEGVTDPRWYKRAEKHYRAVLVLEEADEYHALETQEWFGRQKLTAVR